MSRKIRDARNCYLKHTCVMSIARYAFLRFRAENIQRIAVCALHSIKPFQVQDNTSVRKYEDSFQHWILKMFESHPNYTAIKCDTVKLEAIQNKDIKALDFTGVLNFLKIKKSDEALTPMTLRKIDDELNARINYKTSPTNLLCCLQVYMTVVPLQARKLKAFTHALIQLENRIKKSLLSTHELVQAVYYASHLKAGLVAKKFMLVAIYQFNVENLKTLSNSDLGVLCVSLFRSSVAVEKLTILQFLAGRFKQEIDSLITEEPAIFVSFIKCFRISKYYEDDLINFIASKDLTSLLKLDIVARTHLGVYFSASKYGNTEFINAYLGSCIEDMNSKIINGETPRLKDIDNLLWSCSVYNTEHLNSKLRVSEVQKYIKDSLGLIKKDSNAQISLLLWLWMCSCRLEPEVVRYVTPECTKYITESKNFKAQSNLFLLLTCVHLESPGLLRPQIIGSRDKRLQPKFEPYLNKRPQLKTLLSELQKYSAFLRLENVRFNFIVPTLYIGSICAEFKGTSLSIELIDPAVCLTNSDQLNGRMILKLRLLQKMGIPYILIPGEDSYDMESLRKRLLEHPSLSYQGSQD
uniref:FAST kinase domain-containing protein 5 n=2 Tax=Lygus hesperus TaxID=30085 RepID=A0A0A9W9N9_LYGHE